MNITREDTGNLTATIKIEIEEKDYLESVNHVIKDYQKKANMPGFRPGKVPTGIIRKMYGKAIIAEEVNKLLSETLTNYLKDNNINILGHPLANAEKTQQIDFENQKSFDFFFDIGLSPEVNLELTEKIKINYPKIKVDNKTLNNYIDDICKRNGTDQLVEISEEGDILRGSLVQLDKAGKFVEGGINKEAPIAINYLKDSKEKKKFIDVKNGDIIRFNPLKATESEADTAAMLGVNKDETEAMKSDYGFTVTDISRIDPAKLDKDLYQKVFPTEDIQSEEEFKNRLESELEKTYDIESDKAFMDNSVEKLIEISDLSLPEDFMKRWLLDQNEGKLTEEQIDEEFDVYAKSLKWQLIQNKIIADHNIKVEEEEIRQYIRNYFLSQSPVPNESEEAKQRLESIIDTILENKEEINKINDQLYDQKIKDVLKSTLKLNIKNTSFEDFIKSVTKKNES